MNVHIATCSFCGALLFDYHDVIKLCPICNTGIIDDKIVSEYDDIVKLHQEMEDDQSLRCLVHQKIKSVAWDEDKLIIITDKYKYTFVCENDCCNQVWINHVEGIELAIGNEVLDVLRNIEGVDESFPDGDGVEEAISYTIVTTGGYLDVELRNNHNGYYGGKIALLKEEGLTGG